MVVICNVFFKKKLINKFQKLKNRFFQLQLTIGYVEGTLFIYKLFNNI